MNKTIWLIKYWGYELLTFILTPLYVIFILPFILIGHALVNPYNKAHCPGHEYKESSRDITGDYYVVDKVTYTCSNCGDSYWKVEN